MYTYVSMNAESGRKFLNFVFQQKSKNEVNTVIWSLYYDEWLWQQKNFIMIAVFKLL